MTPSFAAIVEDDEKVETGQRVFIRETFGGNGRVGTQLVLNNPRCKSYAAASLAAQR